MFHLLGFLFIILIAVLVIGLSIVGTVLRAVFGFGRRRTSSGPTAQRTYRTTQTERNQPNEDTKSEETINDGASNGHKKIFSKDDGEYIDFEEVKE